MDNLPIELEEANDAFRALESVALSVVIPTCKRAQILERVLEVIDDQASAAGSGVETIVCDDASGDHTVEVLRDHARSSLSAVAWLALARNAGPARARNAALEHVRGRVVLFLGDDIVPDPGLLARHLTWHSAHPEESAALLGALEWPDEWAADRFMRWIESNGRQFFFDTVDLATDRPVGGMYFYTSNVSVKRSLLLKAGPFDETFPFASHEDLELGLRLEAAGMRLFFDPAAIGRHWHVLDLAGTVRRVYRMGYSSVLFWSRVGEKGSVLKQRSRTSLAACFRVALARRALLAIARRADSRAAAWKLILHGTYWAGVADGRRHRADPVFLEFPESVREAPPG